MPTCFRFFFFNDSATTEIYTLSLHDALPIWRRRRRPARRRIRSGSEGGEAPRGDRSRELRPRVRSEEHTSELQSRLHLVCRLLLEKKKQSNRVVYSPLQSPIRFQLLIRTRTS